MKPDLKFTFPDQLWAGTDESLAIAMESHNALMSGAYDRTAAEEPEVPFRFSIQGSIGVVTIRGPLINSDSPWNKYRDNVTAYSDIRRALIHAAMDPAVESIMLDIDSGGGAVSGVSDTADLISTIDKTLKPVYAFTDGGMSSAAYWLGVSSRGVYASKTSMMGSIGVITTLIEYSKQLKEAGVGVNVVRAGKFKALINSVEAPTEAALASLQLTLDSAYKVFAEHCVSKLKVSMEVFEASMGQGREFFGEAAVTAGLAKGLKTLDSMISMIEAKQIDINRKKGNTAGNYQQGVNMTRQALTETQVAALAAGGVVLDAAAAAVLAAEPAAASALASTPEAVAAAAAATAAAALTVAAAPAAVTQSANENNVLIDFLKAQGTAKDAAFVAQSVELTNLKSKVSGMEATHAGLVKIAAQSVSHMKVAMGLSKVELSAMDPALLLAEHSATATAFASKFPVGGVAAVSATQNTTEAQAGVPHQVAALVHSNRVPARK